MLSGAHLSTVIPIFIRFVFKQTLISIYTALWGQRAVYAYQYSDQMPPFGFAVRYTSFCSFFMFYYVFTIIAYAALLCTDLLPGLA